MSVAQTIPSVTTQDKWKTKNSQTQYDECSIGVVQVRLTAAQLNALKTTPVVISVAPGVAQQNAGRSYYIYNITLKLNFGTTAFTLNAGTLKLFYGVVANAHPLTADLSAILLRTSSGATINIPTLVVTDSIANALNQALILGNDGGANYTLGDSTLDVTVQYGITTP